MYLYTLYEALKLQSWSVVAIRGLYKALNVKHRIVTVSSTMTHCYHHHLSNHTATNVITGQFNHYTIVDSLSRGSDGGPTSLSGVYLPSCECIKRYIT